MAPQVGAHHLQADGGGRGRADGRGVRGLRGQGGGARRRGIRDERRRDRARHAGRGPAGGQERRPAARRPTRSTRGTCQTVASNAYEIERAVIDADLVIGAVLVPGAKAPKLISNELVSRMLPGSVLVDISIDQGGCFEDSHPTTHADPTYRVHNSVFYCVANMPGAVPHTSTYALTNVTLPYVLEIANLGWREALRADPALGQRPAHPRGRAHLRARRRGARAAVDRPGRSALDQPGAARPWRSRSAATSTTCRSSGACPITPCRPTAGTWPGTRRRWRPGAGRPSPRSPPRTSRGSWPGCGRAATDHAPLAASSAARAVAAVRGLHAFAAAEGMAAADVAGRLRPPAPPRRLPRAIGVAEVERLIAAAGAGDGPGNPRPAARPGSARTALRHRGEDLRGGRPGRGRPGPRRPDGPDGPGEPGGPPATLRLSGKGGKQRIVPVGRYAREALDAYLVRARPALAAGSRAGPRPAPRCS